MEKSILKQRARDLRKNSTNAEKHLWYYLRANRLGFKFKRQVPIGNYIVDFVCLEKRLITEIDGGQHLDNQLYDTKRTAWLTAQGFKVLRFWNHHVLQQIPSVIEVILAMLPSLSPTLSREQQYHTTQIPSAGEGADRGNFDELGIN